MQKNWVSSSHTGLVIYLTKGYTELMLVCAQPALRASWEGVRESVWASSMILMATAWLLCKNHHWTTSGPFGGDRRAANNEGVDAAIDWMDAMANPATTAKFAAAKLKIDAAFANVFADNTPGRTITAATTKKRAAFYVPRLIH